MSDKAEEVWVRATMRGQMFNGLWAEPNQAFKILESKVSKSWMVRCSEDEAADLEAAAEKAREGSPEGDLEAQVKALMADLEASDKRIVELEQQLAQAQKPPAKPPGGDGKTAAKG